MDSLPKGSTPSISDFSRVSTLEIQPYLRDTQEALQAWSRLAHYGRFTVCRYSPVERRYANLGRFFLFSTEFYDRSSRGRQASIADGIDAGMVQPFYHLAITETDESRKLEVTISSIYWTLIALFPHLMLMAEPSTSEPSAAAGLMRIPLSVDLALHAVPAIALVLDFFFFERKYTKYQVARVLPLTAILFGLWYVSWVEYCASHNGRCTWSVSCLARCC